MDFDIISNTTKLRITHCKKTIGFVTLKQNHSQNVVLENVMLIPEYRNNEEMMESILEQLFTTYDITVVDTCNKLISSILYNKYGIREEKTNE